MSQIATYSVFQKRFTTNVSVGTEHTERIKSDHTF